MTTINLKEFFYWYINDEFIEVTDEVAAELRGGQQSDRVHHQRMKRNEANLSLDAGDGIEYSACLGEPTPEELLERTELFYVLWNALNSLPDIQGRRVDAHIILGISYRKIAKVEGVNWSSIRDSVREGLKGMKKFFQENF